MPAPTDDAKTPDFQQKSPIKAGGAPRQNEIPTKMLRI
jgi:hypothetical protein